LAWHTVWHHLGTFLFSRRRGEGNHLLLAVKWQDVLGSHLHAKMVKEVSGWC
jgi:hypothetical protein